MDETFLSIDDLKLDRECMGQPTLYFKWAEKLANVKAQLAEANNEHEVLVAEFAKQVRANPEQYGLKDKPTESAINSIVVLDKGVSAAVASVNTLKHKLDVYSGAVKALEQRKSMLALLVELRRQEFNAEPRVTADGRKAVEESIKGRVRRLGQTKVTEEEDED